MSDNAHSSRIDSMYQGDCRWAYALLAGLWLSVLFVLLAVSTFASSEVLLALAIAGGLVLLFNTASIFAMTRHYSEDRTNIYGLDIHYLDQNRR